MRTLAGRRMPAVPSAGARRRRHPVRARRAVGGPAGPALRGRAVALAGRRRPRALGPALPRRTLGGVVTCTGDNEAGRWTIRQIFGGLVLGSTKTQFCK